MITGFGEPYIRKDENNMPHLSVENERFYGALSKVADLTAVSGEYLDADGSGGKHYESVFKDGRALFMVGEFKAADHLRSTEEPFGILPMPKLDESQENYYHSLFRYASVAVIPVTNAIPRETGIILDAWQYLTHTTVTPNYYNVTLSFKGLRNDDSIE
jgi:hypothetical protein